MAKVRTGRSKGKQKAAGVSSRVVIAAEDDKRADRRYRYALRKTNRPTFPNFLDWGGLINLVWKTKQREKEKRRQRNRRYTGKADPLPVSQKKGGRPRGPSATARAQEMIQSVARGIQEKLIIGRRSKGYGDRFVRPSNEQIARALRLLKLEAPGPPEDVAERVRTRGRRQKR